MVTVRAFGDTALLVEASPGLTEVAALAEIAMIRSRLSRSRPDGVIDLVPAARTVLVRWDPRRLRPSLARAWAERELAAASDADSQTPAAAALDVQRGETDDGGEAVEIGIRYDGPDLAETAAALGIRPADLVARHSGATWTVAFTGFAPGFGYLVSDDWPYEVPRLASPRTRVPAGAVGLAAGFTGAYPRATPGGWRLIGSTSAVLFDPDAAAPALLRPGVTVRFRPERAAVHGAGAGSEPAVQLEPAVQVEPAVRIEHPGLVATVQDAGRPGAASIGVAVSGALDRAALRAANRLVGNDEQAAAVEIAAGGFEAVALTGLWFAVTGARGPITIDDRPIDHSCAQPWRAGTRLRIGWFTAGARAYLALRGGVAAPATLGSRATDTLSGLGPAPLRAYDEIRLGSGAAADVPASDLAPWSPPPTTIDVGAVAGPRADAFTAAARATLFDAVWTVSSAADRIGMRLDGPPLERLGADEVPSEGMVAGAIQVPPGGVPTILLADGPVTGGYPVIATVVDADLDALGQASAGTRVRFRRVVLH